MVEDSEFTKTPFPGYPTPSTHNRPEAREPGEISIGGAPATVDAPQVRSQAVILSTKRLTLRAPAERDLDQLVTLANNPAVAKNLGTMPHPYTREDGLNWINCLSVLKAGHRTFAITDRYDDTFMGGCGYRPSLEYPERLTIGYWLGEPYWGNGFAAEAAQSLIDLAFTDEPISEIWITVRVSNYQSKRVIEKCGFQFAHKGMSRSMAVGTSVPIDYYTMSRSTWQSLHAWGDK